MSAGLILVIDDDADFRALIRPELESSGFTVAEAATAAAARRLLPKLKPSLLIVDGLLPDQLGIKLIEELRAEGDPTPMVFASAFWKDLTSFKRLTRDLGVAVVTHKPVVPTVLAEQVRRILGVTLAAPDLEPEIEIMLDETPADPLAELRADYLAALPAKVAELTAAIGEAHEGAPVATARGLAHRLRGTAGSYGAAEVGAIAGMIEDTLAALEGKPGVPATWDVVDGNLMALARLAQPAAAVEAAPRVSASGAEMGRTRVLLVDPDALSSRRLVEAGRRHLLQVITAEDAVSALAAARRDPPDCAFIDTSLGGEGAAALSGALRELPGCATLPLAFVSSEEAVESRIAAVHAGASLFLQKPVDAAMFRNAAAHLVKSVERQRPRVLIIDDDVEFGRQASAILEGAGIAATHLPDPLRVLEVLDEVEPDLVFVDSIMPGMSGLDVCQMMRMTPRWQDLPILFVTVEIGMDVRLAAYRAGVDDYIPKPVVPAELLARVRVRLERARLVRERFSTDALTGLLLRRTFHETATARLAEARRQRRPLSLALLDLDGFKSINDRHGHAAGDDVLATVGRLLTTRLRIEDLRARWGGEEFALVFGNESLQAAASVLDRLRVELGGVTFKDGGGTLFSATFSAGVASYPQDGETLEVLLAVADARLYAAKRSGRDRVAVVG